MNTTTKPFILPPKEIGLYSPSFEHENCGVGFIANIQGNSSHQITIDAIEMLARMDHRGGCGREENTGDGAGIMTNLSAEFFIPIIQQQFNTTVKPLEYTVGNVFLPQDNADRRQCEKLIIEEIQNNNQIFVGFRDVPTDHKTANIGKSAFDVIPIFKQLIIKKSANQTIKDFEKSLYIIRKHVSKIIKNDKRIIQRETFYICSLSNNVIIYKGMLMGSQVLHFYPDLQDKNYKAYLSMVHSRFSTNTHPSWNRAQPCRFMSHNGEINTRSGNHNWMKAREGVLQSKILGDDLKKIMPVIESSMSDSGSFDNVLEFLMINGRSLAESVMIMVPEAWQNDDNMSVEKKSFYQYFSNMMEPWDGPASITFSDGHQIGAILDRNGLRPSRYYETFDDRIIMASEVGVVDVAEDNIKTKGRLRPGKMFLIDFDKGKLLDDEAIKKNFASKNPYKQWLDDNQIYLKDLPMQSIDNFDKNTLLAQLKTFGYSTERMQFMLKPLVTEGRDPVGSMGNDAALSCLSSKSRVIYDYFKQTFAQVTNPAIDSIREEIIMSLKSAIGPSGNLLENNPVNAKRLILEQPILNNAELEAIKNLSTWDTQIIDITYNITDNNNLSELLDEVCRKSEKMVDAGCGFIVLSDKNNNKKRAPISSFLALSTVHQYLVKTHKRTKIGLIVETAEAAEVHHFCLLIGYGADAINPYLAFESLFDAERNGTLKVKPNKIVEKYCKSVSKGMLKVMAKMGISTLESYKGAHIFEAVGLGDEVMQKCFSSTPSRIGGVGFKILQQEVEHRHNDAYNNGILSSDGQYHWRNNGEVHMWEPEVISNLQFAARNNNTDAYKKFAKRSNEEITRNATLRGLMQFKTAKAIDINEVEPTCEIVKRFATGAMSFGSISKEAHEDLAIAMNRIGGKSNTGEGGEDKKRWVVDANGDDKKSAIKQVASGRFGVDIEYLNQAEELQIKISQGAKPGEGGELPGSKVDANIAEIRNSTKGVSLISPPPHHDIYSIEDLSQLIFDLKCSNPAARISIKLVAVTGVGTIASGVVKAKADHIVISGHDGGTGASPLTSIKHAGLPWELGLAETHQTLVLNDLRSRVTLQTDGQLKTGRDVAIAALLGAEEFGFSTAPLITLGCIMMRKCHLNTCPVGIATQDLDLRKKFTGKPEFIINYLFMVAEELRKIMASLGFKKVNEMVGRADMLEMIDNNHDKQSTIDLSNILLLANKIHDNVGTYKAKQQEHQLDSQLDNILISSVKNFKKLPINIVEKITNVDRAAGTMLSSFVVKKYGNNLLADNSININFSGHAGQSLGAFLAKGITIQVEGDANDYVGKGLSGGIIAVFAPKNSKFKADEQIIAGNVCGYGANAGEIYLSGQVAERFCVRNSGAIIVAEGVGDHGLEYMTGGRAVILGEVGHNLGAGMSGGIAYIYNPNNTLNKMINSTMIDLDPIDSEAKIELKKILIQHHKWTNSAKAQMILQNFETQVQNFVKIMPKELKRILLEK